MDVYVVAGGDGAGKTTTALNLTVALREAGAYAAALDADLGGNIASLLDLDFERTLADVVEDTASIREAVTEHDLAADGRRESDMRAYWADIGADRTQFRAGDSSGRPEVPDDEPDVDVVPVIGGFDDRETHTNTDPRALADGLMDLVMAYDVVVVDAGNGQPSASPAVAVADGVLTVTTPDPAKSDAAQREGRACYQAGTKVVGLVANRAGENTSVTRVTDEAGTRAIGVVPEDARTPSLEPIAFTTAGSPAADAYGRLAESVLDWDGTSGLLGPTPASSGTGPNGTDMDTDGDGSEETDDGSGGFLSRFLGDD
jgi:MinD-like ATPase involved in chromosome partitioning or flagellar assembly